MRVSLFKRFFRLIFLAVFGIFSVASSQDFSQVEIKTIKLTDNVYMLMGAGGNIGVSVGEDGVLLIDSQFSELKDKILAALPVITITESLTMYFNGDKIEVTHFPHAHSDGDLAFYFTEANVIHTGDLYFSNGFPFINISSGGTIEGMILSADKIVHLINEDTKVIPGQGPLSNRVELQDYRDMLAKAKERIDKLIKSGKTLEETIAAKPTEGLYTGGESSFPADAFIKVVYMELSKQ